MITNIPEMISIRETATRSGLSYDSIRKKCKFNEIVYVKCGRKILVNWDRFCDYLNGNDSPAKKEGSDLS